jgi:hypothetical protein
LQGYIQEVEGLRIPQLGALLHQSYHVAIAYDYLLGISIHIPTLAVGTTTNPCDTPCANHCA